MRDEAKQQPTILRKPWMAMLILAPAVFIGGAAVMIYEFLAARLLAPYFGSQLEIWAAEIAVCLAGLASGALIGGWWADRTETWRGLGFALVVAGATALPMEPLARWAGAALLDTDILVAWHPLAAALVMSFLPLVALGALVPQAIRHAVPEVKRVGRVAGVFTALSTTGSIAGALSVPYLLTEFGVREILRTLSVLLIVAGVLVMIAGWKPRKIVAVVLMSICPLAGAEILFDKYSAYHHIIVEDRQGTRMLRFDNNVQSVMSLDAPWGGGFEYADFFHFAPLFNPSLERVLFIGLGGGTGPKTFLRDYEDVSVDVIEIDPVVVDVAKEYFDVSPRPRLSIHTGDGRAFLNRSAQRYDAICMDAYATGPQGAHLPYHLSTIEFFESAGEHLTNGGCFIFNAIGKHGGTNADVIARLTVTLRQAFHAVYVFEARSSINTVFVAVHIEPEELDEKGLVDGKAWPDGPWLRHLLSQRELRRLAISAREQDLIQIPDMDKRVQQISRAQGARYNVPVLTDNYAPVDVGRR